MSNKLTILVFGAVGAMVLAALLIPNIVEPRTCSSKNSCIAILKQIDEAKETWAIENHKPNTDEPSMTQFVTSGSQKSS